MFFFFQSTTCIQIFSVTLARQQRTVAWISSVQSLSGVQLSATPMDCSTSGYLCIINSQTLLKLLCINMSQWCHPTILLFPSTHIFNFSQHQGLFKGVSSLHQVAKVLKFQLQHHPINEYSGLISFRLDWLYLLAVQGTLKSLLQHHSSKPSILLHSAFFIVHS